MRFRDANELERDWVTSRTPMRDRFNQPGVELTLRRVWT